jgi:hypothetical protein
MNKTDEQRGAVRGRHCIACNRNDRVDAVHLIPRALGCGDRLCVVPLCRTCHRAYDEGRLDLLPISSPGGARSRPTP